MKGSIHERKFDLLNRQAFGPEFVPEYRFHERRKWRFDRAHPETKTAIELEGGLFMPKSRHFTGAGAAADMVKYLEAVLAGWTVIRLCGPMLKKENLERIVNFIREKEQTLKYGLTNTARETRTLLPQEQEPLPGRLPPLD